MEFRLLLLVEGSRFCSLSLCWLLDWVQLMEAKIRSFHFCSLMTAHSHHQLLLEQASLQPQHLQFLSQAAIEHSNLPILYSPDTAPLL